MSALKRRVFPARDDRGAVATVFAILLAGGVLLGMLALVIDVGQLYAEREELQSGADAAAIAVAQKCARAEAASECAASDMKDVAGGYANANARDGFSDVLEVCGNLAVSTLPDCDPPIGNHTDCLPAVPTDSRPYVEVRVRTKMSDGSYILPPTFAQALAGDDNDDGTTVRACARATYGPLASGTGVSVTLSPCEFDAATDNGTEFGPSTEREFYLHSTSKAMTCSTKSPSFDFPGGFGWLDETEPCKALISAGSTAGGNTGDAVSKDCKDKLDEWRTNATVLLMPIYDGILDKGGSKVEYHLKGIAGFVITGYSLPGFKEKSILNPSFDPCKGSDKCIYGYFTDQIVPATGEIGDEDIDFGVTVVTLVG